MPEFEQKNLEPFKSIYVHFEDRAGMEAFARLVGQTVTLDTRAIWYPEQEVRSGANKRWVDQAKISPNAKRAEDVATQNQFIADVDATRISTKEWTHLVNVGLLAGLTVDRSRELIRERFGCAMKELKKKDFDAACEFLKSQKI